MERIDTHAGAYIISATIRCLRITRPDGRDLEYRFSVMTRRWGGWYAPDAELIEINEEQLLRHPAHLVSLFLHECAHLLIDQSPSFHDAYGLAGESHDPPFFLTDAALLFRASIPPMPSEIAELARAGWRDPDEYLSGKEIIATCWQDLHLYDIHSATRLPPDAVWAPDHTLARAAPWLSWCLSHAESLARDDSLTPAGIAEKALQLYIEQVRINRDRIARKATTPIKKVG
ncbi:MAG: hypothetical protein ACYDEV_04385 [Acidiferrobacter sp.]